MAVGEKHKLYNKLYCRLNMLQWLNKCLAAVQEILGSDQCIITMIKLCNIFWVTGRTRRHDRNGKSYTNTDSFNKTIRIYHNFVQGNPPKCQKICSPRWGLLSLRRCKSLTRWWISLSLCKVVVDYFILPLSFFMKKPFFFSPTLQKVFLVGKRAPTEVNPDVTSFYDLTPQGVHSRLWLSFPG